MIKDTNPVEEMVKKLLTEEEYQAYLARRKRSREIFGTTEKANRESLSSVLVAVSDIKTIKP